MSRKKAHKFTNYIEILDDKADEWRNYAICCACRDTVGKPAAILQRFPNKSDRVKNHLKKCKHFIEEQGGIEMAFKILDIKLVEAGENSDTDINNKRPRIEKMSKCCIFKSNKCCNLIIIIL